MCVCTWTVHICACNNDQWQKRREVWEDWGEEKDRMNDAIVSQNQKLKDKIFYNVQEMITRIKRCSTKWVKIHSHIYI